MLPLNKKIKVWKNRPVAETMDGIINLDEARFACKDCYEHSQIKRVKTLGMGDCGSHVESDWHLSL